MNENQNNGAMLAALGYPMALPQTVEHYPTYKYSVQRTQYNPNKLKAVMDALRTPRNTQLVVDAMNKPRALKTRGEVIAEALSELPQTRSFTGGFGEEIINPWDMALTSFARSFGSTYKSKKSDEREKADAAREDAIKSAQLQMEAENAAREDAIKAAQLDLEADKRVMNTEQGLQWIKFNNPNAGGDASYRFTPERIQEMKELNDKAGRWSTEWGAGMSDMMNTEAAKAWTEFEGLAKQYVQDQLKKIYGASMTEQEGERFFKSMGLSRYSDPNVRWSLLTHQLNDLAIKNGVKLQLDPIPGQNTTTVSGTNMQQQATQPVATNARPLPQVGQIVDGYEFLGGNPADAKNWRAK